MQGWSEWLCDSPGVRNTPVGEGDDTNQANNNANITDVLTYTLII